MKTAELQQLEMPEQNNEFYRESYTSTKNSLWNAEEFSLLRQRTIKFVGEEKAREILERLFLNGEKPIHLTAFTPGYITPPVPQTPVIPSIVSLAEKEKEHILTTLQMCRGNRTRTAKALGIGANTLWRKLKSWGVPPARHDGNL